jgi:hypothetical protein
MAVLMAFLMVIHLELKMVERMAFLMDSHLDQMKAGLRVLRMDF